MDDDMVLLQQLKELHTKGILSTDEYNVRRLAVIDRQLGRPSQRDGSTSPRRAQVTNTSANAGAVSPRRTTNQTNQQSSQPQPSSPRRIAAADATSTVYDDVATSPSRATGTGSTSPRKAFDASQPYKAKPDKKGYKDDHERPSMPQAPRGVVGQRIEMPASLAQFTALKVTRCWTKGGQLFICMIAGYPRARETQSWCICGSHWTYWWCVFNTGRCETQTTHWSPRSQRERPCRKRCSVC